MTLGHEVPSFAHESQKVPQERGGGDTELTTDKKGKSTPLSIEDP